MKEKSKSGVITVGALISAVIVILCIWTAASKVFAESLRGSHEAKTQVISESFDSIEISEVSADVILKEAADGQARAEYSDNGNITHEIDVRSHTLIVKAEKGKGSWLGNLFGWMFSINMDRDDQTVLYLPQLSLEDVKINTVSGDVEISEGIYDDISIGTVSGDAFLCGISAGTLHVRTVSGEVTMKDAEVSGDVKISTVSGDVTGNIEGSHSYSVHTISGEKEYPEGMSGGAEVSVETTSGDVRLKG